MSLNFDFRAPSKFNDIAEDNTKSLLPNYGDILASATSQLQQLNLGLNSQEQRFANKHELLTFDALF